MTDARHPLPLKGHLVNRGVRLHDLAGDMGYSVQYVTEVLNRTRPVSKAFVVAVCGAIGMTPDEAELLVGPRSSWGRGRWPAPA